jgi:hypothetical protein
MKNVNKSCPDSDTQYYEGSRCVPKRTYGEVCSDNDPCYTDKNLVCSSDTNLCG